ncbi:hypothetical protein OOK36_33965 [Streptomyces sp. NBC_00365]|uniref:hypothetical protein n=1 Tax=Streptomyces sp. NBC_00365 TaxID=2975726 RepID=UPI002252E814|nr:hypothetical protein [Streptomyces sp. NBC_00365]MCX5093808.1 hypothetical protein [Streptomyces sp. NBC_00365]
MPELPHRAELRDHARSSRTDHEPGTVKLTDTPVADNTTNGTNSRGGGIFDTGSGTVDLTHSLVTNNRALGTGADGGGIFKASGTVTRIVSPVARNQPNNCGNPSTVSGCS